MSAPVTLGDGEPLSHVSLSLWGLDHSLHPRKEHPNDPTARAPHWTPAPRGDPRAMWPRSWTSSVRSPGAPPTMCVIQVLASPGPRWLLLPPFSRQRTASLKNKAPKYRIRRAGGFTWIFPLILNLGWASGGRELRSFDAKQVRVKAGAACAQHLWGRPPGRLILNH